MAKLSDVITALKNGAVLHFSLAQQPRWELYDGTSIKTFSSTIVRSLLKRGIIASDKDSLFGDVPAQTWRIRSSE